MENQIDSIWIREPETDVPRVRGPASSNATTAEEGAGPWTATSGRQEAETDGRGGGGRVSVADERRPLADE